MLGLTSVEVYNSIFNTTEKNNKFELFTDTFDEFSLKELKDQLEGILNISDITPYHLQHEKIGPPFTEAYKKLRSEKSSSDGYILFLMGYARSPFQDFESSLRIAVGLDEDDIQLILIQYNSNFVAHEIFLGVYSIKGISEAVYTMGDHEGTLQIDYDDISMRTKLSLARFGGTFGTLRFDETSFFNTLLGFCTLLGL